MELYSTCDNYLRYSQEMQCSKFELWMEFFSVEQKINSREGDIEIRCLFTTKKHMNFEGNGKKFKYESFSN